MLDFRLKVFCNVAKNLSFTKAAESLHISQPAVSKHIKELEAHFSVRLFDREGNKIFLTEEGEILYESSLQIFDIYNQTEYKLNQLKNKSDGMLRIGASTTMTMYIIPPVLSEFKQRFPQISLSWINGNSEKIESALLNKEIDLGIIEGRRHSKDIKYVDMLRDELVAVAHTNRPLALREAVRLSELPNIPLVLREKGSGTREIFEYALKEAGFDLNRLQIILELGSTESIKSYLEHVDALAIMSRRAVEKELKSGSLTIIPFSEISLKRYFRFCYLQGHPSDLVQQFIRFVCRHNQML